MDTRGVILGGHVTPAAYKDIPHNVSLCITLNLSAQPENARPGRRIRMLGQDTVMTVLLFHRIFLFTLPFTVRNMHPRTLSHTS